MAEETVELVQRCLANDADALREFVARFQHRVFALCFRMLGHRQDAEDTAQDALMRAVKYLKSWDSTQPLDPWVLKIASNRCRTALGKRSKRPILAETIPEASVDAGINHIGLGEELQNALQVLKEDHRSCFVMFYQEELSIQEISEIMEVPSGTIKTWLHRSRKQLAEHLKLRGITPE